MEEVKHIVFFSGGIASWAAAKRVAAAHGTSNLILFFSDTKTEDEDLYRFLREASENVGGQLIIDCDGRDIWQVFHDCRFLGNSRIDPCSRILKRDRAHRWIKENYSPEDTILYLGIDWTESHRTKSIVKAWSGWRVEFPLCDKPLLMKEQMLTQLQGEGIAVPRLYTLGFSHNNCGGFCVKAGQAHFRNLLKTMPERYAYHEQKEQELREYLGKDVTILRQQSNGIKKKHHIKRVSRTTTNNL